MISENTKKRKIESASLINVVLIILTVVFSIVLINIAVAIPEPSTPTSMINTSPQSPTPSAGSMINTTGGTITNLTINATTQNPRWKGFVGTISGELALQDGSSNALFNWDLSMIKGELYATRNKTIPNWDNTICATPAVIKKEQDELNITASETDSIENTFNAKTHDEFYTGIQQISANSCNSTALNVNNTEQTSKFQEVLLTDGVQLIYTSLLENSTYGFNNQSYDFQMIVAENALEGTQPNTAYYFYIELI